LARRVFAFGQLACRWRRYHWRMARLFILFLIALLPLRGWAVERMVLESDRLVPVASQQQASEAAIEGDCPMHAQMAAHHGAAPDHGGTHTGCQACQLCMPLAALDAPLAVTLATISHAVPALRASSFVSADTARHAKPPIS